MTARRRRFHLVLIWLCAGLYGALVFASEPPLRVAFVTRDPQAPSSRRIEGELRALGLEVVVMQATSEPQSPSELERYAIEARAIATIRVIHHPTGTEVWIADRVTGKTVVRQITTSPESSEDAVAVGTVELLRASLMEVHASKTPPRTPTASEARIAALAYETPQKPDAGELALAMLPAIELPLHNVGTAGHLALGVGWRSPIGVGARALMSVALFPARITDDTTRARVTAEARVTSRLAGVAATYSWLQFEPWVVDTAAGILTAHVEARGEAAGGTRGLAQSAWIPATFAQFGAAFPVVAPVYARVETLLVYGFGSVDIRFVDRTVASWGQPAVLVALGGEARFDI